MNLKQSEQSIETRTRIAEILSRTMPIPSDAHEPRIEWNIGAPDDQDDSNEGGDDA
jgi:hypothetical protein